MQSAPQSRPKWTGGPGYTAPSKNQQYAATFVTIFSLLGCTAVLNAVLCGVNCQDGNSVSQTTVFTDHYSPGPGKDGIYCLDCACLPLHCAPSLCPFIVSLHCVPCAGAYSIPSMFAQTARPPKVKRKGRSKSRKPSTRLARCARIACASPALPLRYPHAQQAWCCVSVSSRGSKSARARRSTGVLGHHSKPKPKKDSDDKNDKGGRRRTLNGRRPCGLGPLASLG
jgi:hypothetical protein